MKKHHIESHHHDRDHQDGDYGDQFGRHHHFGFDFDSSPIFLNAALDVTATKATAIL